MNPKIHVIILNGLPENGKDTFRQFCQDQCHKHNCLTVYRSSIEVPKEILKRFFGWPGESVKDEFWRSAMSELKNFWIRICDGPNNFCLDAIRTFDVVCHEGHTDGFFFTDIREPEEIQKLQNSIYNYGDNSIDCTAVYIDRPSKQKDWGNPSDDSVKNFAYDWYIDNSGSGIDLWCRAEEFIDSFMCI